MLFKSKTSKTILTQKKVPEINHSGQFRDSRAAGVTTEQSRLPIAYFTANNGKSQTILTQKKSPKLIRSGQCHKWVGGNEVFQPQLHSTLWVVVFLT